MSIGSESGFPSAVAEDQTAKSFDGEEIVEIWLSVGAVGRVGEVSVHRCGIQSHLASDVERPSTSEFKISLSKEPQSEEKVIHEPPLRK